MVHGLQGMWVQQLAQCGLSSSKSDGISVLQPAIEPMSPALQSEFLTSGPPGMSPNLSVSFIEDFAAMVGLFPCIRL